MAKKKQRINLIDRNGNSQVVEVNSTVSETPSKETKKSTVSSAIRGGINKAKSDARNYGPLVTVASTVNGLGLGATGSNLNKKDNKDHNLLDNALQVGKNVRAGVQSGLMSIPDSQLYEVRNSLQKGEKKAEETTNAKDSTKELLKSGGKALLYTLSPTLGQAVDNLSGNKEYDEDDNAFQRALKSANNTYNVLGGTRGLGKTVEATGQLYAENQERQGKNDKLSSKVENFQETIDKPAEDYAQQVQLENQNYSKPVQFLGNTGQTVGNMIPSMVVSAATKNPNAGLTTMFLQSKGSATKEALQNGADLDEATAIGTAKGGLEVGTEKLFGGIQLKGKSVFGKGSLDDVIENNVNRFVKNKAANWLVKQIGVNNLGEVAEETISDVVGTFIDKYTTNPNASYSAKDFGNTVGQTIASTLVLNLLGGSFGKSSYNQNLQSMAETQVADIQNRVDRGLMSQEDGARAIEQITNEINDNAQGNNEDIIPVEEMQEALANTTPEDIQQAVTTAIDTINKKVQEGKMDAQQGEMLTTTIQENAQDMLEQQQLIQNENGQMQFDLGNTMESKMEIVQNLNDTERAALTEVTQKIKNGEQLNEQDRAVIGTINAKQENAPIQEEATQPNAIPQEIQNVAQNEFNEDETGRTNGLMTNDEKALEHINDMIERLDATSNENHPKFTEKQKEELRQNALEMTQRNRDYIAKQQEKSNQQNIENQTAQENIPDKVEEQVIKIETPQQERQHYVDSGMNEETAKILSEMPKPEKTSMQEKIKEGKAKLSEEWSYLKRNLVDKGETIYKLGKKTKNPNLYAKYDKRGTTTGEANYDIGVAQTDLKGKRYKNFTDKNNKKTSMSLNQIWEGIDSKIANEYLAHYLNVDRYKQVNQKGRDIQDALQKQIDEGKITQEYADKVIKENEGNKYVFGPSITDEDSLRRVKQLEKEHPELKRFGENVWQYGKNQLQNMVDAGKISQAQANQFLKETPHYVRLQRNVENTTSPLLEFDKNGNVKVNKNIKEFKGSTLDILPFKEAMAQYTLDVRNSIRDNLFAQELAKTLGVGANSGTVTDIEDIFGVDPDLLKDNGDGTYSLTFFNKGVATTIPINEGIYESLQPNKHYKFEDTLPFKGIRKFDNIRKALLTDKNPMFLATNMMKDAFDAPLNSKYPSKLPKNYLRAFKEIVLQGGKGNYNQQYQALGGLQNSYFDNQQFQKQGSKANPLTWIEKANNAIEQLPRLAEFISTMEATGNVDQAMYNAAEITTNFKRGGDVAKAANRNGATFLNASIQGFSKQIRNFTDIQSPKQAVQMLGKVMVLGIAPGLLNDIMWDDDDEYKDMQDYQKDRYYLFKGKNGNWIRIPKGRAVSIFQSAARRTRYAMQGDKNAFKGFGKFASGQVAPNNPFENNIISPFVDVARNESWSGNKIVSDSIKNETHPEEEYTIKTDEFSKWLGKKLKKSPAKINYLVDQYSGAVGDIILPNISKKVTSDSDNVFTNILLNPLKDKFTTNAVISNKSQNDFYEALSKAEDDKKWSKATEEDKARYKYLYNKNLEISKLRKEMVEVQESNKSNKEKYKEVMKYTKEINNISKEAVNDSKNIEHPSKNEYVIGDKHYTVSNGQVNAIKDETAQKAKEYGLSVGDYADITSHYGTIKADKDANGDTIAGSKKQKFIDYVQSKEELSDQQKIAIIQKYYKKYTGE